MKSWILFESVTIRSRASFTHRHTSSIKQGRKQTEVALHGGVSMAERRNSQSAVKASRVFWPPAGAPPCALAHLDGDSSLSRVTLLGQQSRRWRMKVQMPARFSLCGIGVLISVDRYGLDRRRDIGGGRFRDVVRGKCRLVCCCVQVLVVVCYGLGAEKLRSIVGLKSLNYLDHATAKWPKNTSSPHGS